MCVHKVWFIDDGSLKLANMDVKSSCSGFRYILAQLTELLLTFIKLLTTNTAEDTLFIFYHFFFRDDDLHEMVLFSLTNNNQRTNGP